MLAKPIRKNEPIKLIIECRQSGLTDYERCNQHGIKPGTFYNRVKRLKKSDGRSFPRSCNVVSSQPKQEVVKLDIGCTSFTTGILSVCIGATGTSTKPAEVTLSITVSFSLRFQ